MNRSPVFLFLLFFSGTLFGQKLNLPGPFALLDNTAADGKEIRILSWNIQMLPRFLLTVRRCPIKRARIIPEKIIRDSIDIVVFQECFDNRARRILKRKLLPHYPYKAGPANRTLPLFFTNSGIVIYSKFPINTQWQMPYKWREKHGYDKFARKGCLMVELLLPNNKRIQVLGTHLQAGGPDKIRHSQYRQLRSFIDAHRKDNVPQLICGDFNTKKHDEINYNTMLTIIDAADGDILGELCCTADALLNDMRKYNPTDRKIIDYIFYRGNGLEPEYIIRQVRQYEQPWNSKHKDLSDHNAVLGIIKF